MAKLTGFLAGTFLLLVLAYSELASGFLPLINWLGPVFGVPLQFLLGLIFLMFGNPVANSSVLLVWITVGCVIGLLVRRTGGAILSAFLAYAGSWLVLILTGITIFFHLFPSGIFSSLSTLSKGVSVPPAPPGTDIATILHEPLLNGLPSLFASATSSGGALNSITADWVSILLSWVGNFFILLFIAGLVGSISGRASRIVGHAAAAQRFRVNRNAALTRKLASISLLLLLVSSPIPATAKPQSTTSVGPELANIEHNTRQTTSAVASPKSQSVAQDPSSPWVSATAEAVSGDPSVTSVPDYGPGGSPSLSPSGSTFSEGVGTISLDSFGSETDVSPTPPYSWVFPPGCVAHSDEANTYTLQLNTNIFTGFDGKQDWVQYIAEAYGNTATISIWEVDNAVGFFASATYAEYPPGGLSISSWPALASGDTFQIEGTVTSSGALGIIALANGKQVGTYTTPNNFMPSNLWSTIEFNIYGNGCGDTASFSGDNLFAVNETGYCWSNCGFTTGSASLTAEGSSMNAGIPYGSQVEADRIMSLFNDYDNSIPPDYDFPAVTVSPQSTATGTGHTTSFKVTVSDPGASSSPSGTVALGDGGAGGQFPNSRSCTLVSMSSSSAACSVDYVAPNSPKTVTLTASYTGDAVRLVGSGTATLTVGTSPQPEITIVSCNGNPCSNSPSIALGQSETIVIQATNNGGTATWQTIAVSFPSNPPSSSISIGAYDLGMAPSLTQPPSEVTGCYSSCTTSIIYPLVQGQTDNWASGASYYMTVVVTPPSIGLFTFYVKSVAGFVDASNWNPTSATASTCNGSPCQDQQSEYVLSYSVNVVTTAVSPPYYLESVLSDVNPDGSVTSFYSFLTNSATQNDLFSPNSGEAFVLLFSQSGGLSLLPPSLSSSFSSYTSFIPQTMAFLAYTSDCADSQAQANAAAGAIATAIQAPDLNLIVSFPLYNIETSTGPSSEACGFVYGSGTPLSIVGPEVAKEILPSVGQDGLINILTDGLISGSLIPGATPTSVNSTVLVAGFGSASALSNSLQFILPYSEASIPSPSGLIGFAGAITLRLGLIHSSPSVHSISLGQLLEYQQAVSFANSSTVSVAGIGVPPPGSSPSSWADLTPTDQLVLYTNNPGAAGSFGAQSSVNLLYSGQSIPISNIRVIFTGLYPANLKISKSFAQSDNGNVLVSINVRNLDTSPVTLVSEDDSAFLNSYFGGANLVSGAATNSSSMILNPNASISYRYTIHLTGIGSYYSTPTTVSYLLNGTSFTAESNVAVWRQTPPSALQAVSGLLGSVAILINTGVGTTQSAPIVGSVITYSPILLLIGLAARSEYRSFRGWGRVDSETARKLEGLKRMLDSGLITEKEYKEQQRRLTTN